MDIFIRPGQRNTRCRPKLSKKTREAWLFIKLAPS